jgi:RIO-like serine/threonine protein kinase
MTATGADGAAVLGSRLGAGREADVYACGDAAVLKLYRAAAATAPRRRH